MSSTWVLKWTNRHSKHQASLRLHPFIVTRENAGFKCQGWNDTRIILEVSKVTIQLSLHWAARVISKERSTAMVLVYGNASINSDMIWKDVHYWSENVSTLLIKSRKRVRLNWS